MFRFSSIFDYVLVFFVVKAFSVFLKYLPTHALPVEGALDALLSLIEIISS